eukprot:gene20747-26901_t
MIYELIVIFEAFAEKARSNLLGGVPMPWMNRLPGSFPLFVDRAEGAHIIDIDQINYTDFCLGDTGAMTGHAVHEVSEALYDRAKRGITTMMPSTDATHTISVGSGGATKAWNLEPDFLVIGKPIGGGMPAAAYGMSQTVADKLSAHLKAEDVDVSGVGGTLTGNALALAAIRATLSSTLRDQDYEYMIPLAKAWADGVQKTIDEFSLPWNVQQLGCRSEYWFCPPPKDGAEASKSSFHNLESYMHLFALNRGILLTPFHNMALFCQKHSISDVEKHNVVFRDSVMSLLNK